MNKKFFITNFYFYLILIIFFLITLSPIISLYIKYLPAEYSLTLYNGSLDYPSRLPQYLPILREFMESGIFFENSVNKDLAKINIENVRTIPFLIAILPSIVSQNLNFIITINYFLSFFLQLIVIYLITNFFLESPKISLIASICIFFHLDYFTFNPIDVIKNIFFDLEYTISFSDISNNYEIIFALDPIISLFRPRSLEKEAPILETKLLSKLKVAYESTSTPVSPSLLFISMQLTFLLVIVLFKEAISKLNDTG